MKQAITLVVMSAALALAASATWGQGLSHMLPKHRDCVQDPRMCANVIQKYWLRYMETDMANSRLQGQIQSLTDEVRDAKRAQSETMTERDAWRDKACAADATLEGCPSTKEEAP